MNEKEPVFLKCIICGGLEIVSMDKEELDLDILDDDVENYHVCKNCEEE